MSLLNFCQVLVSTRNVFLCDKRLLCFSSLYWVNMCFLKLSPLFYKSISIIWSPFFPLAKCVLFHLLCHFSLFFLLNFLQFILLKYNAWCYQNFALSMILPLLWLFPLLFLLEVEHNIQYSHLFLYSSFPLAEFAHAITWAPFYVWIWPL